MILTPLQKLPNNVDDLGKIIVATGFEWLPKVTKIAQSGHTDPNVQWYFSLQSKRVPVIWYDKAELRSKFCGPVNEQTKDRKAVWPDLAIYCTLGNNCFAQITHIVGQFL